MRILRAAAVSAVVLVGVVLSGCSGGGGGTGDDPVIAPVVMSVDELQGAMVDLKVGQVLDITTGDLAVDSYTGEVVDSKIAEFTAGRSDGSAEFNPGVTAKAVGNTDVTLTNEDGGIEDVTFMVMVTE